MATLGRYVSEILTSIPPFSGPFEIVADFVVAHGAATTLWGAIRGVFVGQAATTLSQPLDFIRCAASLFKCDVSGSAR